MSKRRALLITLLLTMLLLLVPVTPAHGEISIYFWAESFALTWKRADLAVANLPNVGRGYTWGQENLDAKGDRVFDEYYNGGRRRVQYFDKARMEINYTETNPNSLYKVTTGLLVKELVTGNRQYGDNEFMAFAPSTGEVAGDPKRYGKNDIAPTYASFRNVSTFSGNENTKPSAPGSLINDRIDKAGNVSSFTPPEQQKIGGYDAVTQHNIADVFVKFGNQTGLIWNGKDDYIQGEVFFGDPTYVLGRPITEPYWIRAAVAGVEKDVMVQLFERRVLTYTPSNSPAYRVEMGNVGQHYYRWRYQENNNLQVQFDREIGFDRDGLKKPSQVAVDDQGNSYVVSSGFSSINKLDNTGKLLTKWGSYGGGDGQFINPGGLALDRQNNVFVIEDAGNRVQKFDSNGKFLTKWDGDGTPSGRFKALKGIVIDASSNVYIADFEGNNVQKFDNNGKFLAKWVLNNPVEKSGAPRRIAVDSQGNMYVIFSYPTNYYPMYYICKYDRDGRFLKFWDYRFYRFSDIAIDSRDNVFVTSAENNNIFKFDTAGNKLATLMANDENGKAFYNFSGLAVTTMADGSANIYVTGDNDWVLKLDEQGKLLSKWGNYGRGDGFLRNAKGLASDNQGNIYVGEYFNSRIQKFDNNGKFLFKFNSSSVSNDLTQTWGITLDKQGNIYVTDSNNTIKKFDSTGNLLANWTSETSGVKFNQIRGIAVDSQGNIYVANHDNGTVEKLNRDGRFIATFLSRVNGVGITIDAEDNLYIVGEGIGIHKYDRNGKLLTDFGPNDFFGLDGVGDGLLQKPSDIKLDAQGNMYVTSSVGVNKYDKAGRFLYNIKYNIKYSYLLPADVAVDNQGNIFFSNGEAVLKYHMQ